MDTCQEFVDNSSKVAPVRGYLHQTAASGADCLILTHGAGGNCDSPLLIGLANAFSSSGLTVLRCNLPFRQERPFGPPPRSSAERDQAGLRAAVESMRRHGSGQVFLGGHSYGGRQASILAADEPGLVKTLLLLSYPLHPPQRPEELRTRHLPRLQTPVLFVHGTRDNFATTSEMEAALKLIPARTELLSVPGAGHELMKKQNRDTLLQPIVHAFCSFVGLPLA